MRRALYFYPHRRRWLPSYAIILLLVFSYIFYRLEDRAADQHHAKEEEEETEEEISEEESSELTDSYTSHLGPSFTEWKTGFFNILEEEPPDFVPGLQSSCWWESLGPPPYYPYKSAPEMETILAERYSEGVKRRLRCLPDSNIIGFPRCGTSALYSALKIHPRVLSGPKGIRYWSKKMADGFPIRRFVDYFDEAAAQVEKSISNGSSTSYILLEASSDTVLWQQGSDNEPEDPEYDWKEGPDICNGDYIRHVTPEAKIIVIMRQPTNRLYSEYILEGGKSPEDFHSRILEGMKLIEDCLRHASYWACVTNQTLQDHLEVLCPLHHSIYYPYVSKWFEVFTSEQMMCVRFEDFIKDPRVVLHDISQFLGLDYLSSSKLNIIPKVVSADLHDKNKDTKQSRMLPKTRQLLDSFFEPFNGMLAKLLGDSRFLWLDKDYNIVVEN